MPFLFLTEPQAGVGWTPSLSAFSTGKALQTISRYLKTESQETNVKKEILSKCFSISTALFASKSNIYQVSEVPLLLKTDISTTKGKLVRVA